MLIVLYIYIIYININVKILPCARLVLLPRVYMCSVI